MAKNTLRDLDITAANNTDVLGQSTAGNAAANTIDTLFQNSLGLLARAYGDIGGRGTVGGTADAITLASLSTYQTLQPGIVIAFKATAANTGAATLNLDTLGVKKIRRQGDSALQAGDIAADGTYLVKYDDVYDAAAGAWVLLNPTISATSVASAANFRANVDGVLTVAPVWSAAGYVNLGATWTGNQSLDLSAFLNGHATATGNFTFNARTNQKAGQSGIIEVTASGGTRTVSFTGSAFATPNNASLGTITSGTTVAFSYHVLNSGKVMLVRLGTV
jgi:hypothetical protein